MLLERRRRTAAVPGGRSPGPLASRREFSGWGDAHWVFVHAPGGRAGKMNVSTGEVTIERVELREEVLKLLRHYAIDSW